MVKETKFLFVCSTKKGKQQFAGNLKKQRVTLESLEIYQKTNESYQGLKISFFFFLKNIKEEYVERSIWTTYNSTFY